MRVGQPLRLQVDARPGQTVPARIVAIDPALDADGRALVVRARRWTAAATACSPACSCAWRWSWAATASALLVPEEAIVPQGQQFFVWRLRPAAGEAPPEVEQRVAVRLGLRRDGQVQVTQGLQAGDTIVIAGQQRLRRDGTPVRVVDPNRPGPGGPAGAQAAANPALVSPAAAPPRGLAPDAARGAAPCSCPKSPFAARCSPPCCRC